MKALNNWIKNARTELLNDKSGRAVFLGARDTSVAMLFDPIDNVIYSRGSAGGIRVQDSYARREGELRRAIPHGQPEAAIRVRRERRYTGIAGANLLRRTAKNARTLRTLPPRLTRMSTSSPMGVRPRRARNSATLRMVRPFNAVTTSPSIRRKI